MNLVDKLRLSLVDRFQTVSISRRQSVAEHTYNVAVIAAEIASKIDTIPTTTVIAAAIHHDMEEAIFGDIITPAKKILAEAGLNYSKAKRRVLGPNVPTYDDSIMKVVKAADLIDMLVYYSEYHTGRHSMRRLNNMKSHYATWINKQHPTLIKASEEVYNEIMDTKYYED